MSQNKRLLLCASSMAVGHCLGALLWYDASELFDALFYSQTSLLMFGILWKEPKP